MIDHSYLHKFCCIPSEQGIVINLVAISITIIIYYVWLVCSAIYRTHVICEHKESFEFIVSSVSQSILHMLRRRPSASFCHSPMTESQLKGNVLVSFCDHLKFVLNVMNNRRQSQSQFSFSRRRRRRWQQQQRGKRHLFNRLHVLTKMCR